VDFVRRSRRANPSFAKASDFARRSRRRIPPSLKLRTSSDEVGGRIPSSLKLRTSSDEVGGESSFAKASEAKVELRDRTRSKQTAHKLSTCLARCWFSYTGWHRAPTCILSPFISFGHRVLTEQPYLLCALDPPPLKQGSGGTARPGTWCRIKPKSTKLRLGSERVISFAI